MLKSSYAKFAIVIPWYESEKQVLKIYSLTLPLLSTVTSSAVAEADTNGIPFWLAGGIAPLVFPEVAGPNIVTTFSLVINLVDIFAASALSEVLSIFITSICFPSNPPAAFISSNAISTPSDKSVP